MTHRPLGFIVVFKDGARSFVCELFSYDGVVPVLVEGKKATVFPRKSEAQSAVARTKYYNKKHNLGWSFSCRIVPLEQLTYKD